MKTVHILIFSFLISQTTLFAQVSPEVAIELLKNGAVVVNLIYPQKTFDSLIKNGRKEEAMALDAKTKEEHTELIDAFRYSFTFCQVLFVSSNDLGTLAGGDYSVLYDADNNPAPTMPSFFIFAEMGNSPNLGIEGLLARYDNRDYIPTPFPAFVKTWGFLHIKRKAKSTLISEWNEQLFNYYNRVVK